MLVCFQSVAFAGEKHVCRYSGRILEPCPCPPEPAHTAGLEKRDCCDVLSARLPGIPDARLPAQAPVVALAVLPAAVVAWPSSAAPREAMPAVEAAGQGPPRLYLTHRQWLL